MKPQSNTAFYVFLGILFVASCLTVYYVQYYESNSPKDALTEIKLGSNHVEIGKSKLRKHSFANFFIHNVGQNPMIIQNVKVDCHCTVAEWNKDAVKPQDSIKIQVKYDNHLLGYYKRVVAVDINSVNSPVILTFAGETIE